MENLVDRILELKQMCQIEGDIGRACGLSPREIRCVTAVARRGTLSSKELSRMIDLSPSRGSRVIGGLVDQGLITVHQNDHDRRAVDLSLTVEGRRCFDQMEREKALCEERLLECLSQDERNLVDQGLKLLMKAL